MRGTRRVTAIVGAHSGTKVCGACKRRAPLTAFGRRAASADGRDPLCRDCRRGYFRQWRATNRAYLRRRARAYYRENREDFREYNREYQRRRRALMRAGMSNAKQAR